MTVTFEADDDLNVVGLRNPTTVVYTGSVVNAVPSRVATLRDWVGASVHFADSDAILAVASAVLALSVCPAMASLKPAPSFPRLVCDGFCLWGLHLDNDFGRFKARPAACSNLDSSFGRVQVVTGIVAGEAGFWQTGKSSIL